MIDLVSAFDAMRSPPLAILALFAAKEMIFDFSHYALRGRARHASEGQIYSYWR